MRGSKVKRINALFKNSYGAKPKKAQWEPLPEGGWKVKTSEIKAFRRLAVEYGVLLPSLKREPLQVVVEARDTHTL